MKDVFLFFVLLFPINKSAADLEWTGTVARLAVRPSVLSVTGSFEFTNSGTSLISIKKIMSSCRCLSGKANKEVVAAGESGKLEFLMKIETQAEPLMKALVVVEESGTNSKKTVLNVEVDFKSR